MVLYIVKFISAYPQNGQFRAATRSDTGDNAGHMDARASSVAPGMAVEKRQQSVMVGQKATSSMRG